MNKALFSFICVSCISTGATAEEINYKIKQVISNDKVAIIEVDQSSDVAVGKMFLANFDDGKQCSLYVVSRSKNVVTLDTSRCDKASNLYVNQRVEVSLYNPQPTQAETKSTSTELENIPVQTIKQPDRSLSDWVYIPSAGSTLSTFSFSSQNSSSAIFSGTTQVSGTKGRKSEIDAQLSYGITDDLNFSLSFGSIPNSTVDYESGSSYTSSGIIDPSIGMQYRATSLSNNAPFDFILSFGYSPSVINAKTATTTDKGTNGRGTSRSAFGVDVYKQLQNVEVRVGLIYSATGEGKKEDATNAEVTEFGTSDTTVLTGSGQIKINDSFLLNGGIGVTFNSSTEEKNLSTSKVYKQGSYNSMGILIGTRFVLSQDKSLLDINLSSDSVDSVDLTSDSTKLKVKDLRVTNLTASFKYEF